jgi:SAM-dependent methyltransferase
MRQVEEVLNNYEGAFDAVINLFSSMGYWDEETDRKIFNQVLKLTKLNGIFVIHTANRDYLVRHFQARDINFDKRGMVFLADRRLDLESSRMFNVWKYFDQQGDDLKHLSTIEIDHRVYSLHELKKQVEDSGWSYQKCYGGYDMRPFTTDTFGMVLVSKNT